MKKTASRKILDMKKEEEEEEEEGDISDEEIEISLFSAVQLASRLKRQYNHYPWKVMSKIWVELMCYATINCRPNVHAQQPSQGGELLTLVWLLMNHLDLGTETAPH
ncbi:hypothetical protein SLE2022_320850 [Rubroshorea leprosula]